jgi:hypothetical protein
MLFHFVVLVVVKGGNPRGCLGILSYCTTPYKVIVRGVHDFPLRFPILKPDRSNHP